MTRRVFIVIVMALALSACGATVQQVFPTEQPTITPTSTATRTPTPARNVSPTPSNTPAPITPTGGPSPTPLFGPTRTPLPDAPTPTPTPNPNAPRIEFFTSNPPEFISPGDTLTLFWSTRGGDSAVIYRLDAEGNPSQVINVALDGSQDITTRASDRGRLDFALVVSNGRFQTEQHHSIILQCPIGWFFAPPPTACPEEEAGQGNIIEQFFERGRMIYIEDRNIVYALFNDGREPAWLGFTNRYDPAVHPERDENFPEQPGLFQPLRQLGHIWRGLDTVRNRLGLGIQQEIPYIGFYQYEIDQNGDEVLYIGSADGTILQLLPGGDVWQIIAPR